MTVSYFSSAEKGADSVSTMSSEFKNQYVAGSDNDSIVEMEDNLLNGQYKLLQVIGNGASAVVYKAEDTSRRKLVAIKKINFGTLEELNSTTSKEVSNLSLVKHKHITPLHEIFLDRVHKSVCLVMNFYELGDLQKFMDQKIQKSEIVEEYYLVQILKQMAKALMYLHDTLHLVHRDVKPLNIFVESLTKDTIKVCLGDFGLSRSRKSLKYDIHEGHLMVGTPKFMSPNLSNNDMTETAQVYSSVDSISDRFGSFASALLSEPSNDTFSASDIFALGCTLYQLMSLDLRTDIMQLYHDNDFESDVFSQLQSRIKQNYNGYSNELMDVVLSMVGRDEFKRPTARQVLFMSKKIKN